MVNGRENWNGSNNGNAHHHASYQTDVRSRGDRGPYFRLDCAVSGTNWLCPAKHSQGGLYRRRRRRERYIIVSWQDLSVKHRRAYPWDPPRWQHRTGWYYF